MFNVSILISLIICSWISFLHMILSTCTLLAVCSNVSSQIYLIREAQETIQAITMA